MIVRAIILALFHLPGFYRIAEKIEAIDWNKALL
jgi:hypothetical protein